jgi:hypothetical protein
MLLRIFEQLQPCFPLLWSCKRKLLHCFRLDLPRAVGGEDRRYQRRNRKPAFHEKLGYPELARDIRDASSLGSECRQGLVLVDLVHREPCDIFGKRRLKRCRIVAALKQRAGQGTDIPILLLQRLASEKTALPCDDFIAFAVWSDEERLDDAKAADAGDKLAKIFARAALAHVHRRDLELREFDMLKFHGCFSPCYWVLNCTGSPLDQPDQAGSQAPLRFRRVRAQRGSRKQKELSYGRGAVYGW